MTQDRSYRAGYRKGVDDSRESHDSTWEPSGSSSDYEQGYNDGYQGFERACPACLGADTGGQPCGMWGKRDPPHE